MNLDDVMKRVDLSPRLSIGHTWLVWADGWWVVWHHAYRAHISLCLYRGSDIEAAVGALVEAERGG